MFCLLKRKKIYIVSHSPNALQLVVSIAYYIYLYSESSNICVTGSFSLPTMKNVSKEKIIFFLHFMHRL